MDFHPGLNFSDCHGRQEQLVCGRSFDPTEDSLGGVPRRLWCPEDTLVRQKDSYGRWRLRLRRECLRSGFGCEKRLLQAWLLRVLQLAPLLDRQQHGRFNAAPGYDLRALFHARFEKGAEPCPCLLHLPRLCHTASLRGFPDIDTIVGDLKQRAAGFIYIPNTGRREITSSGMRA